MRPPLFATLSALLISAGLASALADAPGTALNAIKQLPRGEAKKIARIEARDGTPAPERWHILVNDPKDENGLHEYVVAGGEVVASRNISQFAESLKPTDVVGGSSVKVDSDKLAALAQQYAQANSVAIASLNYALKKEGTDAVPLWYVTCLDEAGKEVGHLVVSAGKGNVVSHEGFTAEPGAEKIEAISMTDNSTEEERRRSAPRKVAIQRKPVTPVPEKKDNSFVRGLSKFFTGH